MNSSNLKTKIEKTRLLLIEGEVTAVREAFWLILPLRAIDTLKEALDLDDDISIVSEEVDQVL